ncbi:MAG: beta-1,6-N-acetylglucosaminyltransferase [Bacilli bacterium]|jgi:hypothetical protein
MKKHAYLYLAHNDLDCLQRSIDFVDDERNDIFVHVDLKCNKVINLKSSKSHLFLIPRTKVYWGGYSQTNATFRLMEYAKNNGSYDYYHLLAENALPVKSQDSIHEFFDKNSDSLLYFHVNQRPNYKLIVNRAKFYYPFIETDAFRLSKIVKGLSLFLGRLQALVFINRLRKVNESLYPLWNGWEWFSIPEDFVTYMLSKENVVQEVFHKTLASEEVFFMSLAANNPVFRKRIFAFNCEPQDIIRASKVYQDWSDGKPKVFDLSDYEALMTDQTDRFFFARKFNSVKSKDLIDKIEYTLSKKGE